MSPLMLQLREALDQNHIFWFDDTEASNEIAMERTKIPSPNGTSDLTSVVYIYPTGLTDGWGFSYGYPDMLEVWNQSWTEEPIAMTVEDILDRLMNNGA